MSTPTSRTTKLFEDAGYRIDKCEQTVPYKFIKKDLHGFADHHAYHPAFPHVLLVQSTSGSNSASRVEKIWGSDAANDWLRFEYRRIFVVSWAKRGARGKRKLWTPRIVEVLSGRRVLTHEKLPSV